MNSPASVNVPPVEAALELNLSCTRANNGLWTIRCPEWKCQLQSRNLTASVAVLLAEIESHNDEVEKGQLPVHKDWNRFAEEEGLPRLKPEHWPTPPPRCFGKQEGIDRTDPAKANDHGRELDPESVPGIIDFPMGKLLNHSREMLQGLVPGHKGVDGGLADYFRTIYPKNGLQRCVALVREWAAKNRVQRYSTLAGAKRIVVQLSKESKLEND